MKKIFLLLLLLPFFSYGEFKARIKYFKSVGSTNVVSVTASGLPDETSLYFAYYNCPFGICLNHSNISSPSSSSSSSVWIAILNNQIDPLGGNSFTNSPSDFPRVWDLYVSARSLILSGYAGPGVDHVFSGARECYNVNFPILVSDILSSTNSLFRQILLSHLSSISASVQNIELNVSGLQSSIDQGNNILSNIDQSVSSVLSPVVSATNILTAIDSSASSILSAVDLLHDDWTVSNIDVFLGDDTQAWIDFLDLAVDSGLLYQNDSDSYANALLATDPSRLRSYSISDSRRRFFVKREIKNTVLEAQKLRGHYQSLNRLLSDNSFHGDFVNVLGYYSNHLGIGDMAHDIDMASDSIQLTQLQLSGWQDQLRQDLQDWKHSDERGILNVRDDIRKNFSYPDRNSTNYLPFTSFVTNFVTVPVTNVVRQSANDISSNVVESAQETRELLNDKLFDPNAPGVNVRIKYPLWETDSYHVNVRDDAVIGAINDSWRPLGHVFDELINYLDLWQDQGIKVNFTNELDFSFFTNFNFVVTNTYMLLDDYENYISNGFYSSSVSALSRDFPSVYSNLLNYGLSPSGDGNFWTLFGSSLLYQSGLVGQLLEDMATVRSFANDHIDGGFSSGISSLVDKFPSSSQFEDHVNQASNVVVQVLSSSDEFEIAFSSLTNFSYSSFSPFRGLFDSVPESLVFFKTGNDQYITIPVGDVPNAWLVIRLGVSFSLAAVNVILFPKFVLWVVLLFSRLSKRFVKFVPTDR